MAAGAPWGRCGAGLEVAPLREVMLSWPGDELRVAGGDVDRWLLLAPIDLPALQRQTEAVVSFYESVGVRVRLYRPALPPPPNLIFMRDLFAMTPQGAILGRMAGEARAGEERFAAEALAQAGVPILHTVRGNGVFEGADLIWLAGDKALVGVGFRTNAAGWAQVAAVLAEMNAQAIPVALPPDTQHLLGVLNPVDLDLAVVREDAATPEILGMLASLSIRPLLLPRDHEVLAGRAMNFVCLGPRTIVMPARCPVTRKRYEAEGIECSEVDVGEYLKAAGAMGCFTGILRREIGVAPVRQP